jgi:hypothetical protein
MQLNDNWCVVYFFCPETRDKSPEEIDLIFIRSDTVMNSVAAKTLRHQGKDLLSSEIENGTLTDKNTGPKSVYATHVNLEGYAADEKVE